MSRYFPYCPDQAELVAPSLRDVPGSDHLCFLAHKVVQRLDLSRFHSSYGDEGGRLYHPTPMLKVWLYAYALGVTSSRRPEQRMRGEQKAALEFALATAAYNLTRMYKRR